MQTTKTKKFAILTSFIITIFLLFTIFLSACTPNEQNNQTYKKAFESVILSLDKYFEQLDNGNITNDFEDDDQTECPTCKLKRMRKISTFFLSIIKSPDFQNSNNTLSIKATLTQNADNHYSFNGKFSIGINKNNLYCTFGFADANSPSKENFQFYRFDIEYNSTTNTFGNFVSQFYLSGTEARLNYITYKNNNFSLLSKSTQSYQEKFNEYQTNGYNNFVTQTSSNNALDFSEAYKQAFGVS